MGKLYLEVKLSNLKNKADNDWLISSLGEIEFESFVDENKTVLAYIQHDLFQLSSFEALLNEDFPHIEFEIKTIAPENWNQNWESNFEAVVINKDCVIRAPFHPKPVNLAFDVVIMPRMSFGTGHHQTTKMMCEWILELDFKGQSVLDMGCGTGVLGILAMMKNAEIVVAIDIEDTAVENTEENFENNGFEATYICGTADSIPDQLNFDVILANINRNIILQDFEKYIAHLKNNGLILMSGFLNVDENIITDAANHLGFKKIGAKHVDEWASICFQKNV